MYFARPIATGPRQKHCGMFTSVEGAFDNKTIAFDSTAVTTKGGRASRSGSCERILDSNCASDRGSVANTNYPASREDGRSGVVVTFSGNDYISGRDNEKVSHILHLIQCFHIPWCKRLLLVRRCLCRIPNYVKLCILHFCKECYPNHQSYIEVISVRRGTKPNSGLAKDYFHPRQ